MNGAESGSTVQSGPGATGEGEGLVGGRGVGDTGSGGNVVGSVLENDIGTAVRRDDTELGVELEGETDDLVRVLGVETAGTSVALL